MRERVSIVKHYHTHNTELMNVPNDFGPEPLAAHHIGK